MKLQLVKATSSQTVLVFIQDSSSTTGAGLASLTAASGSLTAYYYREGAGTGATVINLVAVGSLGTWESGGFFEVDGTNMPGWYELGIPDACLATGVDFVGIQLKGAANMAQCNLEIQLTDLDLNDGVRAGLTALPNVVADGAGGLPISDVGGLNMDGLATSSAQTTAQNDLDTITGTSGVSVDDGAINSSSFAGGAITSGAIATDAIGAAELAADAVTEIRDAITGGAWALNTTASGNIGIDWANVEGQATAGVVLSGTTVGTITTYTDNTLQTGDSFGRLGAPAGASIAADLLVIDNFVDGLESTIGAAGAGLTGLGGMSAGMKAEVNTEVDGALDTAIPELGVAAPATTPTVRTGLMLMYMAMRNQIIVQTSGVDALEIYNDAGVKIASKALTDDGQDYTEAKAT